MKKHHLFVASLLAIAIPWAALVQPLGVSAQLIGLSVQLSGIVGIMVFKS